MRGLTGPMRKEGRRRIACALVRARARADQTCYGDYADWQKESISYVVVHVIIVDCQCQLAGVSTYRAGYPLIPHKGLFVSPLGDETVIPSYKH